MTIETVSLNRSHGGMQGIYKHGSRETGTSMTFSVYVPPHQGDAKLPVVRYLSGLTSIRRVPPLLLRLIANRLRRIRVCTDNLNAGVAVMKSAQDGA
jgi:hypothetical protein